MQQFFLRRIMYLALTFFLSTSVSNSCNASLLRYIFGTSLASDAIQKINNHANEMTGFTTHVLKMNRLAKKLGYSSFNWFNTTWIDEDAVKNNSELRILWQLIHEKYHTLARHDIRRIIAASALAAPLISGLCKVVNEFYKSGDFPVMPYIIPYAIPSTLIASLLFLWHEEYSECQANAYANELFAEIE